MKRSLSYFLYATALMSFFILVSACAPTHDAYMNKMSALHGMTKSQLIKAMGMQPTGVYTIDSSTQLVVFLQDKIEEAPPSANTTLEDPIDIQGYNNVPQNLFCKTTFVLQQGKVTNFNYEGNACSFSSVTGLN